MTPDAHRKKLTLITPPYHYGLVDVLGRWIPLNFVYLAGAARQAGLEVEIYDAQAKLHGYPEIEARLLESRPDFVACSAITATVNEAVRTLELAQRALPGVVTVLGGVHASFMYRELLEGSSAVGYVVLGEGEETLRELLATLQGGGTRGRSPASPSGGGGRSSSPAGAPSWRASTSSPPPGTSWTGRTTPTTCSPAPAWDPSAPRAAATMTASSARRGSSGATPGAPAPRSGWWRSWSGCTGNTR